MNNKALFFLLVLLIFTAIAISKAQDGVQELPQASGEAGLPVESFEEEIPAEISVDSDVEENESIDEDDFIGEEIPEPIELTSLSGNIDFDMDIAGFSADARTGSIIVDDLHLAIRGISAAIGNMTLDFAIYEEKAGIFTFDLAGNYTKGSTELLINITQNNTDMNDTEGQAQNETSNSTQRVVLTINSLNWQVRSNAGDWLPTDYGLTRNFTVDLAQNGSVKGKLFADLKFEDLNEENITAGEIFFGEAKVGNIQINDTMEVAGEPVNVVTNYFRGFVSDVNGRAILSGQVRADVDGDSFFTKIMPIFTSNESKGWYGSPSFFSVSGVSGSEVSFYVNEILTSKTNLTEGTVLMQLDLKLPVPLPSNNFADADRDGVPDVYDKCPDSEYSDVNANGCSCMQLSCEFGCKSLPGLGPWTCNPPPDLPTLSCEPNTCLAGRPKFCNEASNIVNDCKACGCPDDFACGSDGQCYRSVELEGVKCLTNNYEQGRNLNCAKLGENWVRIGTVKDITSVKVKGWNKLFRKYVKKKINKNLNSEVICIEATDLGCIQPGTQCIGDAELAKGKAAIGNIVQREIDDRIKKEMPSIARYLGIRARVKLDLSKLTADSARRTYSCEQMKITPDISCKPLISNGQSSDKADLLFIGDGFFSDESLINKLNHTGLLDYEGKNKGTANEGLFSREPYASNKEKFNIWYLVAGNRIKYEEDPVLPGFGRMPTNKDINKLAALCPQHDYIVVLSNNAYRSNCGFGAKAWPCKVSLARERYPGRLLVHELGHGIGRLADEYYNRVITTDNPGKIEAFNVLTNTGLNCKADQKQAENVWGNLVNPGGSIGYFKSCGGDCDAQCADFVRPTFNSVMNHEYQTCKDGKCETGPPFEPHYAVNDEAILKELKKYR